MRRSVKSCRPATTRSGYRIVMLVCAWVIVAGGCRAVPKSETKTDTRIRRLSDDGRELYAEGDVDSAITKYQAAVLRAWAMDDPAESGTIAYNLAACLTSAGESGLARDWLADARHELKRAGQSSGNAWLLEAKIATDDGRFADASRILKYAACIEPPCDGYDDSCGCPTPEGCKTCPLSRVPCIGTKIQKKQTNQDCENGYKAQIHLARARLAAEEGDLASAATHFECACGLIGPICSHGLHAELHDVAGWMHVASDEYVRAGWHFDREAKHLRLAANYREIPGALELAATAFENAGMAEEAAERWNRVARIWLGRGDETKAWEFLRRASDAVDQCLVATDNTLRIRLSIVAREIEFKLRQAQKP